MRRRSRALFPYHLDRHPQTKVGEIQSVDCRREARDELDFGALCCPKDLGAPGFVPWDLEIADQKRPGRPRGQWQASRSGRPQIDYR